MCIREINHFLKTGGGAGEKGEFVNTERIGFEHTGGEREVSGGEVECVWMSGGFGDGEEGGAGSEGGEEGCCAVGVGRGSGGGDGVDFVGAEEDGDDLSVYFLGLVPDFYLFDSECFVGEWEIGGFGRRVMITDERGKRRTRWLEQQDSQSMSAVGIDGSKFEEECWSCYWKTLQN